MVDELRCYVCGSKDITCQVWDIYEMSSDGPWYYWAGGEARSFCREHQGDEMARSRTYYLDGRIEPFIAPKLIQLT